MSKIHSNFPKENVTRLIIETILDPDRESATEDLRQLILCATEVDGTTGEKGLGQYSTIGPADIADIVALVDQAYPQVWKALFNRTNSESSIAKRLYDLFLFHLETRCLGKYYPNIGDAHAIGAKSDYYDGVLFTGTPIIPGPGNACEKPLYPQWLTHPGIIPSMFTLYWHLQQEMKGIDNKYLLAQVLVRRKSDKDCDLLPYDLFYPDPAKFQTELKSVLVFLGEDACSQTDVEGIRFGSLKKNKWRLAILRSESKDAALWLHFASGRSHGRGGHGHYEGINLGLFAKGLDLLPDFGYPPINQYGGWETPQSQWYQMAPAHNTMECLSPVTPPPNGKFMWGFEGMHTPNGPWEVDWKSTPDNVHVRYLGFPNGADLHLGKLWVANESNGIPCMVLHRRLAELPPRELAGLQLQSTFVGIIEAHGGSPKITKVRRLGLQTQNGMDYPDSFVAIEITIEITIEGGDRKKYRDLIVAADVEDPLRRAPANRGKEGISVDDDFWNEKSKYDAELLWIRIDEAGKILASSQYPSPMGKPLPVTASSTPCPTPTPAVSSPTGVPTCPVSCTPTPTSPDS